MGIFINSKGDLYILASAEANSPWSHNIRLHMYHIFVCEIAAVHIYAGVAANLAERKKLNQLMELLRNIKGTIDDDDWDQVQPLLTAVGLFHISKKIGDLKCEAFLKHTRVIRDCDNLLFRDKALHSLCLGCTTASTFRMSTSFWYMSLVSYYVDLWASSTGSGYCN